MAKAIPHIHFDGTAEEAFNFYKSVFGGELNLMRWKDNSDCSEWSDADKEKVMHASLASGQLSLMGNDSVGVMGDTLTTGNNFTVTLMTDTRGEADEIFAGLSAGGEIRMPMQEMFWGDYYGAFTDKFGVQWMIDCESKV